MINIIEKIQEINGETLSTQKIKQIKNIYTILKLNYQNELHRLNRLIQEINLPYSSSLSPSNPSNTQLIRIKSWIVELLGQCIEDEYIYIMMLSDAYFSVMENIYYYIRVKLSLKYHMKRWMRDTMEWMIVEHQVKKKFETYPLYDSNLMNLYLPNYWQYMYQNTDSCMYLKQMELKSHYERYHILMDKIVSFQDRIDHLYTFYFPNNPAISLLYQQTYQILLSELSKHFFNKKSEYWDWSQEEEYFSIVYNELLQMDFTIIDEYMSL